MSEQKKTVNKKPMLTMEYVLRQIEEVRKDNFHITAAINKIGNFFADTDGISDDKAEAMEKSASAIVDVVRCRETTNQQLLKLYEKMYDDLKEPKILPSDSLKQKALDIVNENHDFDLDQLSDLLDTIRHLSC